MLFYKIIILAFTLINSRLCYPIAQEQLPDTPYDVKPQNLNEQSEQTNLEAKVQDRKATEENSVSFDDLLDSFGDNSDQTDENESATVNTRTGFYFLLDWNSFLDIDDQLGRRVNLRFQPKVGDPKRFLSVSVP
ncbi:hypothetical protein MTP99_013964 [Tenebrio molitor]|jgi:hypothetical protein|uniref:Uncharacterized protein n=1 Tax=Tenebrio molitor TaxID=7067 RepID=A0A8J6LH33_TENMO|nr:hypothetical protein GEV33_001056 [Tenebrio molitor]KAJ3629580.1 hypothetical protein MTP99_013964 [Tenebrio molitor]